MTEQAVRVDSGATSGAPEASRRRTRTCVGCGERVDLLSGPSKTSGDLLRVMLGSPGDEGAICIDLKGGAGRGAYVHARRACLERAARSGLLRATKGKARHVVGLGNKGGDEGGDQGGEDRAPLSADALARAIERSMDRRIEELLAAAVRSRSAVACEHDVDRVDRIGGAPLLIVACDAASAVEQSEVRRAVADGRAIAWASRERLGSIVAPRVARGKLAPLDPREAEGVGVLAVTSRAIGDALSAAVRNKGACRAGAAPPRREPRASGDQHGAGERAQARQERAQNEPRNKPRNNSLRSASAPQAEPPARGQRTRGSGARRGSSQRPPSGVGSNVERGE